MRAGDAGRLRAGGGLTLETPLVLPDEGGVEVQVGVRRRTTGRAASAVYSPGQADERTGCVHARGGGAAGPGARCPTGRWVPAGRVRCR